MTTLSIPVLPAPLPQLKTLVGRTIVLEPLSVSHAADLYAELSVPEQRARFDYLWDVPPDSVAALSAWIAARSNLADPQFSAVIDARTGRALGRQALMRVTAEHGVIEIGHILWSAAMARTPLATEALFLAARYVFDDLHYRRFEWKCDSHNEASKRAALRFGFQFEGVFRQHMWLKGHNRDTAWFAMLDHDWPRVRAAYESWLTPENFDAAGQQRRTLAARAS